MEISEGLNKLIEASLVDGDINSKETTILINKAVNEGLNEDEFKLYLDSLEHLRKKETASAKADKVGSFFNKIGSFFKWISKKKSRVAVAGLVLLLSIIFIARMGLTEIEKKQKEFQTEFECDNVEDCLTKYNFEGARAFASIEDEDEGKFLNEVLYGRSANVEASNLTKIVKAEVNYYISHNEFEKAKNSALEAGKFFIYKSALPSAINSLVNKDKVSNAISILSKYTFQFSYDLNSGINSSHYYDDEFANFNYNEEANQFNGMVNSVFTTALFNKNKEVLKKCLLLYVPILSKIKNRKKLKLIYQAKNTAKTKLKEARIRL